MTDVWGVPLVEVPAAGFTSFIAPSVLAAGGPSMDLAYFTDRETEVLGGEVTRPRSMTRQEHSKNGA